MSSDSQDYQDSQELDNDAFFELREEEVYEDERDQRSRWLTVGLVILSVIFSLLLCLVGIRQLSEAHQNEGFEDKSWVMTGSYVDLTPDLQTKSNVAIYRGQVPGDDQLNGVRYLSNLNDPQKIQAGQNIDFRGSQTGNVEADFPQEVDALLVKTADEQVEVVRTGDKGSLKPVTSSLVTTQKVLGWFSLVGAVLIFAGGVAGAIFLNRRHRAEEDY